MNYFLNNILSNNLKVTFAPNLAKKISTNFYYLSLLFQLSVAYSENFKEIKAWEVLKFWKEKIGILPIYFAWRQKLIVFTLCQVCTLYENSITEGRTQRGLAAFLRHFLSLKCRSCLKLLFKKIWPDSLWLRSSRIQNTRF